MTPKHGRMAAQAWASMGFTVLTVLIAPVRIAVLTRAFSRRDYGLFSLLTITATSLGFVGLLGLRQFLIYALPGKDETEQGRTFNSCLLANLLSASVVAGLFVVSGRVFPLMVSSYSMALILIAGTFILLYTLAHLGLGLLLAKGRVILYRGLTFMISSLWVCVAIAILAARGLSLTQLAGVWLAGLAVTLIFIARSSITSLGPGLSARPTKSLMVAGVRYGTPLLPRYFALALFKLADRFVILRMLGPESVAVYTVAATLVMFAAETQMFLEFIFPHMSNAWNENLRNNKPGCTGIAAQHFHTSLRLALLTTVPMGAGLVLWGRTLVLILAGADYAGSAVVFPVFAPLVPLVPLTALVQFAITLGGKTVRIGNSILAASLLNVGLNILLIPRFGILGAAAATTFSYALLFLATLFMSKLRPYMDLSSLRLPALALAAVSMIAAALGMRWIVGKAGLWEIPVAGIVFLLAGYWSGLWSKEELLLVTRRNPPSPPKQGG